MSVHTIRFPDLLDGCRALRDLLRDRAPNASDGFVLTDLDLIVRWWGPNYGLDRHGVFALIEVKRGEAGVGYGQRMTFELLDRMLRSSPEAADRYLGYYVLHDHGGGWRWAGDPRRYTDDELVAELVNLPRGLP